jgi:hypothetical protein
MWLCAKFALLQILLVAVLLRPEGLCRAHAGSPNGIGRVYALQIHVLRLEFLISYFTTLRE